MQITISFKDGQMESGLSDCGLFAIDFATALIFGRQSGEFMFQQRQIRSHLIIQCISLNVHVSYHEAQTCCWKGQFN